jgi:hypothetical protein
MALLDLHEYFCLASRAGQPGLTRLEGGRAVSIRPSCAGELRVVQGRIWATFNGNTDAALSGDHVASVGEQLALPAGVRVVLESWAPAGSDPVLLAWVPQPAPRPLATRWQSDVAGPSSDVLRAFSLMGRALFRLVSGAAAYATFLAGFLAAGRGRTLSPFDSNPP